MSSHADLSLRQRVFELLKKYPNLKAEVLYSMLTEEDKKQKTRKNLLDLLRHYRQQYIHDYQFGHLSERELGYIAGIIDGEGHVNIVSQYVKGKGSKHGEWFTLRISIGNTNRTILEWLQKRIGGCISANKNLEGYKTCYHLQLNAKRVRWLAPKILPYVVGKKEEVTLLMKSFPLLQSGKRQNHYAEVKELQYAIRLNHGRQGKGVLGFDRR
jgi:hypothetical protein